MEHIIEVAGLKKRYGKIEAVKGIDFYVERGKLFAFLGPNGAGKSTTIDILSTLLRPDEGTVLLNGHQVGRQDDQVRDQIGVVFQDSVLDKLLTVRENLVTRSKFYDNPRETRSAAIQKAAQATGIADIMDRPYGKLSGGQRRRADIARALVNTPEILFLDEPTTGLDPQTRRSVWNTIFDLQKQREMTVFFSTHYMEEAQHADYIIIIDHGVIVAKGTPTALKQQYAQDTVRLLPGDSSGLDEKLAQLGYIPQVKEGGVRYVAVSGMEAALLVLSSVSHLISDFEVVHGTMDDVFIHVTGAEVRES